MQALAAARAARERAREQAWCDQVRRLQADESRRQPAELARWLTRVLRQEVSALSYALVRIEHAHLAASHADEVQASQQRCAVAETLLHVARAELANHERALIKAQGLAQHVKEGQARAEQNRQALAEEEFTLVNAGLHGETPVAARRAQPRRQSPTAPSEPLR